METHEHSPFNIISVGIISSLANRRERMAEVEISDAPYSYFPFPPWIEKKIERKEKKKKKTFTIKLTLIIKLDFNKNYERSLNLYSQKHEN